MMLLDAMQGVANRGASIRVGRDTEKEKKGKNIDSMSEMIPETFPSVMVAVPLHPSRCCYYHSSGSCSVSGKFILSH